MCIQLNEILCIKDKLFFIDFLKIVEEFSVMYPHYQFTWTFLALIFHSCFCCSLSAFHFACKATINVDEGNNFDVIGIDWNSIHSAYYTQKIEYESRHFNDIIKTSWTNPFISTINFDAEKYLTIFHFSLLCYLYLNFWLVFFGLHIIFIQYMQCIVDILREIYSKDFVLFVFLQCTKCFFG